MLLPGKMKMEAYEFEVKLDHIAKPYLKHYTKEKNMGKDKYQYKCKYCQKRGVQHIREGFATTSGRVILVPGFCQD
jgi:predicted SprT family Zn-dependent metalloprotease